jgi:hypothetical protein
VADQDGEHSGHEDHQHEEHEQHEGRAEHFEGKPAKDLEQALKNFREANDELATLLAKDELSSSDMTQVHKLSYTIENAMARLEKEMDQMSDDLEWVHKASERMDSTTVRAKGKNYLDAANKLAD